MLKRSTSRLLAALAAAGTICALGVTAATTASATDTWSGRIGPVPHAFTDAAPAMTSVTFASGQKSNTLVAWAGQSSDQIFYSASPKLGVKGNWTARAAIPHAMTSSAPSIASYRDPNGQEAVLAVWRGATGGLIRYAQGEVRAGRKISWTAVHTMPAGNLNTTDAAPAVYFAQDRYAAVVAYRGPYDHIRYFIGVPARRGFKWNTSQWISPTAISGSSPTIAELQTSTGHGNIFVFWKDKASNQISYSTTPDPLPTPTAPTWTAVTVLAGSKTSAVPAAAAAGPHGLGPLLLAYKAPHNTHVLYRTLTNGTWNSQDTITGALTTYGPALLGSKLGVTSPTSAGNIFFHLFG